MARNGSAFENMTKEKQKDNPKFSFLFGGQNYAYYKYKLTTEQQGKFGKSKHSNLFQVLQ